MKSIKRKRFIVLAIIAACLCFVAHCVGNVMGNNGYRSASMAIASMSQSDKQRELYGPSHSDLALEARAQECMRQGENAKSIMNTFAAIMAVLTVVFGVVSYKQNRSDTQKQDSNKCEE